MAVPWVSLWPTLLGAGGGLLTLWGAQRASASGRLGAYGGALGTGFMLAAAIAVMGQLFTWLDRFAGVLFAALFGGVPLEGLGMLAPQPGQLGLVLRFLGAAGIVLLYFRSARINLGRRPEGAASERAAEGLSQDLAVAVVLAGVVGHNLWMGQVRGVLLGEQASPPWGALMVMGLLAVLPGLAALAVVARGPGGQLRLAAAAGVLWLGLLAGLAWPQAAHSLLGGFLPLLLASGALAYGIGLALHAIEGQVGTGWRTTVTVLVGAGAGYGLNRLILQLIAGG